MNLKCSGCFVCLSDSVVLCQSTTFNYMCGDVGIALMALTEGTGSKSNKGVTHLDSTYILNTPFLHLAKTQHILSYSSVALVTFFPFSLVMGFFPQFYFSVIAVMSNRFAVVSTCHKSYVSTLKLKQKKMNESWFPPGDA